MDSVLGISKIDPRSDDGFVSDVLCSQCNSVAQALRKIQAGPALELISVKHHLNIANLKKSAQGGCHLCARLAAIENSSQATSDLPLYAEYKIKILRGHENKFQLMLQTDGENGRIFYLVLEHGKAMDQTNTTLRHQNTDAPPVLALGKDWLMTCRKMHRHCSQREMAWDHDDVPTRSKYKPTRLVHVKGTTERPTAHLIPSNSLPGHVEYLTLSHCWGGANIHRLTTNTLEEHLSAIDVDLLPQNFWDALKITISLGFQYIWIDSFCIIQDSEEDWNRESAMMGDVYRYSTCTIASVAARDSHGGCFQHRSARDFMPCQIVPDTTWGGAYSSRVGPDNRSICTRVHGSCKKGVCLSGL